MDDIGSSNPVINVTNSPSSYSLLEPLTLMIGDRLNLRWNTKCPPLELEFLVQFNKDNHLVMKSRPVDIRHIILLPFLKVTVLTNLREEDRVTLMLGIH